MARFSNGRGNEGGKLYFTDFSFHQNMVETTTFGDGFRQVNVGGGEIEFSGVMPMTEGSRAIVNLLLRDGGIDIFQERREWRCIYCASPNPIEHRHCSQCGGPRGWIL